MESSPNNAAATPLQPVQPIRPAAGYIGGKRNLARRLVALIGATPHALYAEPFVGMGGVFLRRDRRPAVEVINDWSEDVATFFRILQRHYVAFVDMLRFQLTTRAGFERLMRTDPSTLTMADQLASLRGRFILSLNARPEVREAFARFAIEEVPTTYSLPGADRAQRVSELIITGP